MTRDAACFKAKEVPPNAQFIAIAERLAAADPQERPIRRSEIFDLCLAARGIE